MTAGRVYQLVYDATGDAEQAASAKVKFISEALRRDETPEL